MIKENEEFQDWCGAKWGVVSDTGFSKWNILHGLYVMDVLRNEGKYHFILGTERGMQSKETLLVSSTANNFHKDISIYVFIDGEECSHMNSCRKP